MVAFAPGLIAQCGVDCNSDPDSKPRDQHHSGGHEANKRGCVEVR